MKTVAEFIDNEEKAVVAWFKKTEPKVIQSLLEGYDITKQFITAVQSKQGVVIETLIDTYIPKGKVWTEDAVAIATLLGKDMLAASSDAGIEAIGLRLLAELGAIISGKEKLGKTIGWWIGEAQNIFTGE